MTVNQFPYQTEFENHLKKAGLAAVTIREYRISLVDLFNYLSNFNVGYQQNHHVNQVFDRDVEDYMQMLLSQRRIAELTYNKVLSHLNVYFKFLFQKGWNRNFPTVGMKGNGRATIKRITTKWLNQMPELLADQRLHIYTRLTLLLISHGYGEKEFLQPGFIRLFKQIQWTPFEQTFVDQFKHFIKPIQQRQQCPDLFLKQRFDGDPHVTLPGLHKYLRPDQKTVGFSLSPSRLLQGYMIHFILQHPQLSIGKLSDRLKVEPASILYYQNLIDRHLISR